MTARGFGFSLALLIGMGVDLRLLSATAQTAPPKDAQPSALEWRQLTGDDARRAVELDRAIAAALKADRWDEAIARARGLVALRTRVQGPKHFETVTADWLSKGLCRVAPMAPGDRVAYQPADALHARAEVLWTEGKYAAAQPLYEETLAIRRRLLTDDHPLTAQSYMNLAVNLTDQGKYAVAQAMLGKALELRRVLLTDDHPDTAQSYLSLAYNLNAQGKYAAAQPLYEKALEINRRLFTDDNPHTALVYKNLALNLNAQGKHAAAQPLFEKALEIRRRLLSDDHPFRSLTNGGLASNLNAQGRYLAARDRWRDAVKSLDKSRLRVAFAGLDRAATRESLRPALAAVLARLGQPAEAWQALEEDLGRGLLDELAARKDGRLTPAHRDRLRELTAALERLDRSVETTPKGLDQAGRATRFADLRHRRELASIALGEFQARLVQDHGALAGPVAGLDEIQAALPADAALVTWVDLAPAGPNAADPDGEHWGVVVRSRGVPAWIPIAGTGPDGLWTEGDTALAGRVRTELQRLPAVIAADLRPLVEALRALRLEPLNKALATTSDGLPPARSLIVLPSRAMAGIPVETLLSLDDDRTVSYAPSATVFKYLHTESRPDRHAGLLALGDPVYGRPDGPGEPTPAPEAVAVNRGMARVPRVARSGDDDLKPLPGTRYEVEALARLFRSDDRPARTLIESDASEPELDRLAASGDLGRFGFIHLATHGVIDEDVPLRSAVILTLTGLPDPLEQVLHDRPAYDGRLSVREIQRGWELKAELVTLSACETALGREAGGEGFVGFTQALLISGARSVCLSLWKVDDAATAPLMQRFYADLLGRRPGLGGPMPKSEALGEAKAWLRGLRRAEVVALTAELSGGVERGKGSRGRRPATLAAIPAGADDDRPFASPHFWAAFVLAGDPD